MTSDVPTNLYITARVEEDVRAGEGPVLIPLCCEVCQAGHDLPRLVLILNKS